MEQQDAMRAAELEGAISQIVVGIWKNMFGVEIGRLDGGTAINGVGPTLTSSVHIIGDWHGSVVLHCTEKVALFLAERLYASADGKIIGVAEAEDVLRELVNMVGGNLKPMLGERCVLTTPKVTKSSDFITSMPETDELVRLVFNDGEHCFVICLHVDTQDINTQIRDANGGS